MSWALAVLFGVSAQIAFGAGKEVSPTVMASRDVSSEADLEAREFIKMLAIGEPERLYNNLRLRAELVQIANLANEGKYTEALAAFERYFLNKLRYPAQYGLSTHDVNPYVSGIGGRGMWPAAFLEPKPDPAKVQANADRLMRGMCLTGGKEIQIGNPGQVNWNAPLAPGETVPAEKEVARPLASPMRAFAPLVQAYLLTRNEAYLKQWADYLDDWSRNARYFDEIHPCMVPSLVNAPSGEALIGLARQLGAVVHALPADREPLPPAVLARVIRKMMREQLLGVCYLRSNAHNWTPGASLMLSSLLYDEFRIAPTFFREAVRRNIEDNAVTQNLRDGTENQQCPWYNENYLSVEHAFRLLDSRTTVAVWQELPWVMDLRKNMQWRREIQEHLNERVNWFIHSRTPQNEWPIPIRGGDKRQAYGVPGDKFYPIAPQAYGDPANAAIVSAMVDPKAGVRPPYTDEWFPYAGYNYVRQGWESDSGYGFLFCSPKPGAYGAYRSRSNNNTFGLSAFGQDLLVDDNTEGHYMHPGSPITVDVRALRRSRKPPATGIIQRRGKPQPVRYGGPDHPRREPPATRTLRAPP